MQAMDFFPKNQFRLMESKYEDFILYKFNRFWRGRKGCS